MKCYCVTFDITNRSPKTVHVSKNSTFQIGVKVLDQNGKYITSIKVRDENNTTLTQSGTLAQYRLYSATSGDSQGSKQWSISFVQYTSTGAKNVKLPPLTFVTTSSDVAELPGIANADLTDYYTKEQVDTKVSEAVAPLAPTSSLTAFWKKSDTEEHQLSGTYEDGTEFSFTAICKKS